MEDVTEEKKTIVTGFRLTQSQARKLRILARRMGVTKNAFIGVIIDAAIVQAPVVEVDLPTVVDDASETTTA